jgi:hypothetical protein
MRRDGVCGDGIKWDGMVSDDCLCGLDNNANVLTAPTTVLNAF